MRVRLGLGLGLRSGLRLGLGLGFYAKRKACVATRWEPHTLDPHALRIIAT